MNKTNVMKLILLAAGVIGCIVGAGMIFTPVQFHASSGIELSPNVNLLNEMRAAGGPLFFSGIVIIAGVFVRRLTVTAWLLAALMYLSYGFGRLVAVMFDGIPDTFFLWILGFEIVVGVVCMTFFLKLFTKESAYLSHS